MPAEMNALPEPETKVAGAKSENWPQNQKNEDLEAVAALYAKKNTVAGADNRKARLTPDQMRGINIYSNQPQDPAARDRQDDVDLGGRLTPTEMRQQNDEATELKKQATANTQGALPVRRYLTEPPAAYSTPSPDAPMPEVVTDKESLERAASEIACAGDNRNLHCKDNSR